MKNRRSSEAEFERHNRELKRYISPFLEQEKLTHLYLCCGSLKDPEVVFEYAQPSIDTCYFDLASLTKVLVTVPLVFSLSQKQSFGFKQSLAQALGARSAYLSKKVEELSISSLLTHSSGLPAWRNFWMNRIDRNFDPAGISKHSRAAFLKERMDGWADSISISENSVYSDVGFILLGLFLELLTGTDISDLFDRFCTEELAFSSRQVLFPKRVEDRALTFAPTAFCPIRERRLFGEVHDENAFSLGGACGHAGLFASGGGLGAFMLALFRSEIGASIIDSCLELRRRKLSSLIPVDQRTQYLVGWQESGFRFSPDLLVLRHLGFTGTGIWILPEFDSYIIILTNRVYSSRLGSWIQQLREDLCKYLWVEVLNT